MLDVATQIERILQKRNPDLTLTDSENLEVLKSFAEFAILAYVDSSVRSACEEILDEFDDLDSEEEALL